MGYSKVNAPIGGGGKAYEGSYFVTPNTSDVIIPSKHVLKQDLVIKGDSDLIAENIKEGVNIFGVDGNLSKGMVVRMGSITLASAGSVSFANPFGLASKVKRVSLCPSTGISGTEGFYRAQYSDIENNVHIVGCKETTMYSASNSYIGCSVSNNTISMASNYGYNKYDSWGVGTYRWEVIGIE